MIGIIYLLTSPSGKQYVGQTIQELQKRINGHNNSSNKNDAAINKAIRKYGINSFRREIIITIQTSENNIFKQLDKLEELFIKIHNTYKGGYNSTTGGGNRKPTDEVRKKLSISHIGIKQTEESKIKRRLKMLGFKHSDESKDKIRQANIGKKISYDDISKIITTKEGRKYLYPLKPQSKGWKLSKEVNDRMGKIRREININGIPIIQLDLNNNKIFEYKSATEAYRQTNINISNIAECCKGKRFTAGKFKWKYKEDV